MLVQRTIEKKISWEFESIIMQNMSHNLLLFCAPTWPSHHVIGNHLYHYILFIQNFLLDKAACKRTQHLLTLLVVVGPADVECCW